MRRRRCQRLPARRERLLHRFLLERGEVLPLCDKIVAAARELGAGGERRPLQPLALGELGRQRGSCGCGSPASVESSSSRTLTSSSVPPRSASTSSGGRRAMVGEAGEQRRNRLLLGRKLLPVAATKADASWSRALAALIRASAASIACAAAACCGVQPVGLVLRLRRSLVELRGLRFRGGLLGKRRLQSGVERLSAALRERAPRQQAGRAAGRMAARIMPYPSR